MEVCKVEVKNLLRCCLTSDRNSHIFQLINESNMQSSVFMNSQFLSCCTLQQKDLSNEPHHYCKQLHECSYLRDFIKKNACLACLCFLVVCTNSQFVYIIKRKFHTGLKTLILSFVLKAIFYKCTLLVHVVTT